MLDVVAAAALRGPEAGVTARPCAFCGLRLTAHQVEFECAPATFQPLVGEAVETAGIWTACWPCAPLVRARRWRELLDRVLLVGTPLLGDADLDNPVQRAFVRTELGRYLALFAKHATGDEREVTT